MIAALINHLWQSTLCVVAAAIVAFALRKNGAHIRHRIWLAASLKFLVPFSLLMNLGGALVPAPAASRDGAAGAAPLSVAVDRIAQPFADEIFSTAEPVPGHPALSNTNWTAIVLAATWLCGLAAVGSIRFRGWRRIRAAVNASAPADLKGRPTNIVVRSSPSLLEPGVVGIWRPILLVPAGIEQQLTRAQLDAVLEHELCHVERRDNLTSAIHMVVEAIFWFHPLVWVVGAKLIQERERACDEHVLRVCGEPQTYAESILNVCKRYVESPVAFVSGVSGADLKRRVSAIVNNRVGVKLNLARRIVLIAAAALAVLLPLVAGVITAPLSASVRLAEAPGAKADAFAASQNPPSSAGATFDVVSIKPCDPNSPPTIGGAPGRRGYPPWVPQTSPGYVVWTCATLTQLIDQAYADKEHPLLNMTARPLPNSPQPKRVRGGPSWVNEDKFMIEAKMPVEAGQRAGGNAPQVLTTLPAAIGQSLRALLENRLQLKVHRATEQQEMYALTIAKSGLNKTRVTVPKPGDCQTIDQYFAAAAQSPPAMDVDPKICGRAFSSRGGGTAFTSFTLQQLAADLSQQMDLFVLDRTGVTDPFNFALLPGGADAGTGDERWISRLAELGLKIDRIKAPAEYLQIDSVQKPRPDFEVVGSTSQPAAMKITFEAISIRPCETGATTGMRGAGNSPRFAISPGYVSWGCVTLNELIETAWGGGAFPNNALLNTIRVGPGERPDAPKRIRGGPPWVNDERFAIEIRISGDTTDTTGSARHNLVTAAMTPALRAMLEERFQLKLRKATEQQPMYALKIAAGRLKLTPFPSDRCYDAPEWKTQRSLPPPPPGFEGTLPCGFPGHNARGGVRNGNQFMDFVGISLKDFATWLSRTMDRFVLDQTATMGRFNFRIEYLADESMPGDIQFAAMESEVWRKLRPDQAPRAPVKGDGPTIFKALQALGLTLEKTTGPAEYLLIESAQRPTPGGPDRP